MKAVSVPEPWTALQVERIEDTVEVLVQGRRYRFGQQAALPTSIETAGVEILAGPVRLVGSIYGKPIEWQTPYLGVLRQSEAGVVLTGAMETTGVIISNSVKVEYDGMIRFDLAITPFLSNFRQGAEQAHGLGHLWVEIPLKAEYASLFTYWPIDFGGVVQTVTAVNCDKLPADGIAQPFKPFFWLGWEEGGLSWFAESDQGWQPANPVRAIEVIPGDGVVTLRLRVLDSQPAAWVGNNDSWYKPNSPVTISFGMQATPVKPVCRDATAYRTVHLHYYESVESISIELDPVTAGATETVLDRVAASGANVVVLHEFWNSIQNYWVHDQPEKVKATVAACHARGLKIIPYFGYEVSTLAPEWAEMHDRILIKGPEGRYQGGWQRLPSQRDYMVCYASEWQQKWLDGVTWMMDTYGFDGVYLDGTSMPSACANNAHQCGYRHPDGSVRATYPIYAVRKMFQQLYERVNARDGVITAHQSSCCLTPTLEYVHTYWDGEHIGGAFKHDADGRFPLEVFRAEFMGWNFGIQAEFLSGQPEALAYTLIHNVMIRPGLGGMLDAVSSIWKAFTDFGTSTATWLPYWRNADFVQSDQPDVYVSAYVRDGRALLAVANLAAEGAADAVITLKQGAYASARDAVSGETLAIVGNAVTVGCGAMRWRLVEVG